MQENKPILVVGLGNPGGEYVDFYAYMKPIDTPTAAVDTTPNADGYFVEWSVVQTYTANVIIKLIDVNEKPVFVDTTLTFPENQKGYPIGSLTYDDLDTASGFRNNKFECLNCEDLGFYLDETTGELSTTRRFDYETEEKTYKLNIVIKDVDDATLSTTGSITVALTNVYEFTELVYTVLESDTVGTPFKKALEVDNTEGLSTTLKFSILDGSTEVDATKEFKLDSVTGKFSVASPLDYETTESYSVRVRAKDENGVYGDTTITINVIDVNEAPDVKDAEFAVEENSQKGDSVGVVVLEHGAHLYFLGKFIIEFGFIFEI